MVNHSRQREIIIIYNTIRKVPHYCPWPLFGFMTMSLDVLQRVFLWRGGGFAEANTLNPYQTAACGSGSILLLLMQNYKVAVRRFLARVAGR